MSKKISKELKDSGIKYGSGISLNSIIGTIYAMIVFIPAIMYLRLMTGSGGIPVSWFTVLVVSEFLRLRGTRLGVNEAVVLYLISGAEMFVPLGLPFRTYFRRSPITKLFGLTHEIPLWYSPELNSPIYHLRTIFHPDWIIPLGIMFLASIAGSLLDFSLGFLARRIYLEAERLEFPLQRMDSDALTIITGREERPLRVLSVAAFIGFVYGIVLYAFPFIYQAWTGQPMQVIPVPWYDWTRLVEANFPGAIFGLATDIAPFASAFIIPGNIILAIFVASYAVFFFGNHLTVRYDLAPIKWWVPGLNIRMSLLRSIMYFWAPIQIGFSLAVGLAPIFFRPKLILGAFKRVSARKRRMLEEIPMLTYVIIPMAISFIIYGLMFAILVPSFTASYPWIVALSFILPFVYMLVSGRMRGEAGVTYIPAGNVQNLLYLMSGYKGADVWFVPSPMTISGGSLSWFAICEMTKTSAKSLVKMYWLLFPVSALIGLGYLEAFWKMAPIPSGRYPGAQIFWPIDVSYTCLWIRGQVAGIFNVLWILYSFLVGTAIYAIFFFTKLPISLTGLAIGAGTSPPFATSYLIGLIIAKFIERIIGKEAWEKYRRMLGAGLIVGESIAVTVSVAISIIINSIWILPI